MKIDLESVAELTAEGRSLPQIAAELGCSTSTVSAARRKLRERKAQSAVAETIASAEPSADEPEDMSDEELRRWARRKLISHIVGVEAEVFTARKKLAQAFIDQPSQACRDYTWIFGVLTDKFVSLIKTAGEVGQVEAPSKIRPKSTIRVRED